MIENIFSSPKLPWSLIIFVSFLMVYSSPLWLIAPKIQISTDILPTTLTPISLIKEGDFDLNEFTSLYQANQVLPYYLTLGTAGHLISFAPPLGSLLAVPVYKTAQMNGFLEEHTQVSDYFVLERISAALIASMSMTVMFLVFYGMTRSLKKSLALTAILGLATNIWSSAGSDLWQHTPLLLVNGVFLLLLVQVVKRENLWPILGLVLALGLLARVTALLTLSIVLLYTLLRKHGYFFRFIIFALVGLMPLLTYNYYYLGNPLVSSYAGIFSDTYLPLFERGGLTFIIYVIKGTATLLFAPSGGFLIYSPILLLAMIGALSLFTKFRRRRELIVDFLPQEIYTLIFILMIVQVLVLGSYGGRGGIFFWGSRFSVDFLPFLSIFLVPAYDWVIKVKWRQVLAGVLLTFSILVQILGVYFYRNEWDAKFWPTSDPDWTYEKDLLKWWSLKDGQLIFTIRQLLFDRGRPTEN